MLTFLLMSSVVVIPTTMQNIVGLCKPMNISDATPLLTWTSRTQNESLPVNNGSSIVGNHVTLNATFPEVLNVTSCEMRIWNGFTFTTTRSLVPVTDPAGAFTGVIDLDEFDWVIVTGIEKGMQVNITANFTNEDSDIMAWPGTLDSSEYTFANNIADMCSGYKPENDVILWNYDNDTLVIGCLNYDNTTIGTWTLSVQVGIDVTISNNASSIAYDTYYLQPRNQTYNIHVIGDSTNNDTWEIIRQDVEISNFFSPLVLVPTPQVLAGEEDIYNITWSCFDSNTEEIHLYSVWVSNNDGITFMIAVRNQTQTCYLWDSSGWLEDAYLFRIRAYSIDLNYPGLNLSDPPAGYLPGDYSDVFTHLSAGSGVSDPTMDVAVESASDIFYNEGETGNKIEWVPYVYSSGLMPGGFRYYVYLNGSLILEDYFRFFQGYNSIEIDVDDLTEGIYNYTLLFHNPGSSIGTVRDVVIVTVGPPLINNQPQTIIIIGLLGVTILIFRVFAGKSFWKSADTDDRLK
ncbi:MAG: hypothetical protein ACFFCX_17725 [Candidatus Sifarchaeia archaeon]